MRIFRINIYGLFNKVETHPKLNHSCISWFTLFSSIRTYTFKLNTNSDIHCIQNNAGLTENQKSLIKNTEWILFTPNFIG